jgi:hypothetical protein
MALPEPPSESLPTHMTRVGATNSTILPPPSDFPVAMPEVTAPERDSGEWRAIVETTRETIRPGSLYDFEGEDEAE